LLREGEPIGLLTVLRMPPRPYTEAEIALLESFADQAAIAIAHARLFSELEQRNAELQASNRQVSEALEQQTALAEVLRVIAASPTDVQRVLEAIAESAARVCGTDNAMIRLVEGDQYVRAVAYGLRGDRADVLVTFDQPDHGVVRP